MNTLNDLANYINENYRHKKLVKLHLNKEDNLNNKKKDIHLSHPNFNILIKEFDPKNELKILLKISKNKAQKIKEDINYPISKKLVFKIIISLKLTIDEAEKLLNSLSYYFDSSSYFDLAIKYFLINQIYDEKSIKYLLKEAGINVKI